MPQTGIIDYVAVTKKYAELFLQLGGMIHFNQKVANIIEKDKFSIVQTQNKDFQATTIINCAGLYSDEVTKMTDKKVDVQILPFRGEYFSIKKEKNTLLKI